jgi:hypothetical protein
MESSKVYGYCTSESIIQFAKRNYETYLAFYKSRNLQPMPFDEFIKNYSN